MGALPPKPPMAPAVGAPPPSPGGMGGSGGFAKGGAIGVSNVEKGGMPPDSAAERDKQATDRHGPGKAFAKGGSVGESRFGPVGKPRGESWPGGGDSKPRHKSEGSFS
jgi:hypothetical protein